MLSVAGQTPRGAELAKGKTIEKIVIETDESQTYALYLPSSYDASKKFPVIYCFDPRARGGVAVERFRVAAEKYGYIVIGSNTSQNGVDNKILSSIISNLWDETQRRFSIDERRVIAAGFSGGARVASSIAFSCNGCIFGVIGSGAGFSPGSTINEKMPFLFFGTAGYNDFNYPEMRLLSKKLTGLNVTHRFEVFDGSHQWLDETLSREALGWFELQAMKANRRAKDDALIEELFQTRVRRADAYIADKKYLEAYSTYAGIAADFAQWRDVSVFADKIMSLEKSSELKQAIKSESEQFREQDQEAGEIGSLGEKLSDNGEKLSAHFELRQKIETLRKKSAETNDSPARRVARRTVDLLRIQAFESALFHLERDGKLAMALTDLELAGEISPKDPQIYYYRARIYATQGDKKKAIESLTKAVELGMKDIDRLTNEKSFQMLRNDESFLKLVAVLKGSSGSE
ncbi:MAG: tetratricopeptide repeat protein [Pyrinomonadaceae bacterium]